MAVARSPFELVFNRKEDDWKEEAVFTILYPLLIICDFTDTFGTLEERWYQNNHAANTLVEFGIQDLPPLVSDRNGLVMFLRYVAKHSVARIEFAEAIPKRCFKFSDFFKNST